MQIFETSAKPSTRSEVALLNSGLNEAAVHGRNDLAAGQRVHRGAHALEHVNGDADRAELETFEVIRLCDRLLVPAERLGWHRSVRERDDVRSDRIIELVEQFLAAAVLVPG